LSRTRRASALLLGFCLAAGGCAGWLPGAGTGAAALRGRLAELPVAPPPAARLLLVSIAGLAPAGA